MKCWTASWGIPMRLNHSVKSTGLIISGLLVLGLLARSEAAAGSDCPCINAGAGVCVPDPVCETRQRQMRDRLMQEHEMPAAPRDDRTMRYWPQTRPAAAPRNSTTMDDRAPAPSITAPAPRNSTTMDYRGPPPMTRAPPTTGVGTPSISTAAPMPRQVEVPAHAQAQPPAADGGKATAQSGRESRSVRHRIFETGYSLLSELGKEDEGYGLYSYAIFPSNTRRAEIFLTQLFKEIPSVSQTSARRSQLNIFYVPLQKERERDFATLMQSSSTNAEKMGADYSKSFYDYRMARALLNHVCNPPADSIRQLCEDDLSRGPYIFTYASPASSMNSVPPPFLFVDLSNVHAQAFAEFIDAFRTQVKRDDITDQARIQTLRLTILNVALTAADWVNPVQKAIAGIVHLPSDDDKK